MGRLSGLNEGEAITADVRDDRAEAGEVLVPVGPLEEEILPMVVVGTAEVRPPPDCKMLKPGKAGEMDDEDVVEIGKSVDAVTAATAPRVAVRSSGEIDG